MCAAAILVMFLLYYGFAFNVVEFVYHIATAFELTACVRSNWTVRSQTSLFLEYPGGWGWRLASGSRWSFCLKMRDPGNNVYRVGPTSTVN